MDTYINLNRLARISHRVRREAAQMAVVAGTRSGEDPKRIGHTLIGLSREDARQVGQIRGRSRSLVRNTG